MRRLPRPLPDGASLLSWGVLAAASALGVAAARSLPAGQAGPLGLLPLVPVGVWAALAALTCGFFLTLRRARLRTGLLLAHVVGLVVLLHGVATLAEPVPRFATGWLHIGFTEYIARTGSTLPLLDARFSWPGFFGAAALLVRLGGLDTLTGLLTWSPLVLQLLYLGPLYLICRRMLREDRVRWMAVWLFYAANWVGQDYFSPQGLAFFFYLVTLAVLLTYFGPGKAVPVAARLDSGPASKVPRRRPIAWLRGLGASAAPERPPLTTSDLQAGGLVLVVLVVFAAVVVGHQLTPFAILSAVTALVLTRRCTLRGLPLLMGALLVAWISYGTVAFWSGHLDGILGDAFRLGSTVDANVSSRVGGGSTIHVYVSYGRIGLTLLVWVLAALGLARWFRRERSFLTVALLALAPFPILVLQSYGGEALLRIYVFALPFVAMLAAAAFGRSGQPARLRTGPAVVVCLALMPLFMLARYGNERFEQVRPGELAAVSHLYDTAAAGSTWLAANGNLPWRYRLLDAHEYRSLDQPPVAPTPVSLEAAMRQDPQGSYLILTTGQFNYAEDAYGFPTGWGRTLVDQLLASPEFRRTYANADASIFSLAAQPTGRPPLVERTPAVVPLDRLPPIGQLLLAGLLLFAAPGVALVGVLQLRDPLMTGVLGVALSLAVAVVVATVMLVTGAWSPLGALVGLATVTVLATLTGRFRPSRAARHRGPRGRAVRRNPISAQPGEYAHRDHGGHGVRGRHTDQAPRPQPQVAGRGTGDRGQ